jgi:hypothetical protein
MNTTTSPTVRYRAALTLGFLCVTAALVAGYRNPATGYELSVYAAAPTTFWVGVGAALLLAVAVVVSIPDDDVLSNAGLALAATAVLAVVGLPVLRGYAFHGGGDSLTHLGWAREIHSGVLRPDELLYPAIHIIGNFLFELGGVELTRGLVVLPAVVFPAVSVVFFGLCLRAISDSRWAFPVGVLVGLLFIPINLVSVHVLAHPSSQAILFAPVVLFLLFRHLTSVSKRFVLLTPFGALLGIATVGMVLVHPQETLGVLLLLFAIVTTQALARRYAPTNPLAVYSGVGVHAALLSVVLVAWIAVHERASSRAVFIVESLLAGGETLTETTSAGTSVAALGGSFELLFLKLFAGTIVVGLLALVATYGAFRRRFRELTPTDPVVGYLTAALVPLGVGFLVIFFAAQGDHYFRILGFITVPVTLVGGLGLTRLVSNAEKRLTRRHLSAALGAFFVAVLLVQLVTVHASPYVFKANQQVTDQSLEGHDVTFEYHDGETPLLGTRLGSWRYIEAHYGFTAARGDLDFPGFRTGIPGPVFNDNLTTFYETDRYIAVTESDRVAEVELYDEFRYSETGFERLDRSSRIHRLQDNGEYQLYRLDPAD